MMLSKVIYKIVSGAWTPWISIVLGYVSARRLMLHAAPATQLAERLSLADNTLLSGYAENIQRSELALGYCRGKRVLDAGCGTGYGAHFLASQGAASVFAVDISEEAIDEAKLHYVLANLQFAQRDIEKLDQPPLPGPFDVVVNFEALSHLRKPDEFLRRAVASLAPGGTMIISTPNGQLVERGRDGRPLYEFQFTAYTPDELRAFLAPHFRAVTLHGQFLTHEGKLRRRRAREVFEHLSDAYHSPFNKVGRALKRAAGKKVLGPPAFTAHADSFSGDYAIVPLTEAGRFTWPPTTLIAVCTT